MTINSRAKGAAGEREFAALLRSHGYTGAYRGQQFQGGTDSPDVVCPGLEEFHFEVKRVERGALYDWVEQAVRDAGNKTPVVAHRKNKKDWVAVIRFDDFMNLLLQKGLPNG